MGERAELAQCGERVSVAMHHGQCDEEGREAVPRGPTRSGSRLCPRQRGCGEAGSKPRVSHS